MNNLTPPSKCPKLTDLADACLNGACNTGALIRSIGQCVGELPFSEAREHPAVKIILGQLTYLCGETLGPTHEALDAYEGWRKSETPKETEEA